MTREQGLAEVMTGADVMIHNAGVYEIGADRATVQRMQSVNVDGTRSVLTAASKAGIARNIYVSTVWALGATGRPPTPSIPCDETHRHDGRCLTPYERSKAEAHQLALSLREMGTPMTIIMPNGVVGANDHSNIGYLLRLTMLGAMLPIGFNGNSVLALVDVDALADGVCLAAEHASMGEDYLFCGDPASLRQMFALWGRETSRMTPKRYLPAWFMRPQMILVEAILRGLGLPAFLSRETVDASRVHLDYTAAKAKRDLGWVHPSVEDMWPPIILRERELMAQRQGFIGKLRHLPVVMDA